MAGDHVTSSRPRNWKQPLLMITFATFGVSFSCARWVPSSSVRTLTAGRKAALTLSILLMMIGTLMTPSCRPTRTSVCGTGRHRHRACGFSAGGEFGSSTAFWSNMRRTARFFFQLAVARLSIVLAAVPGAVLLRN
jgi:MHS family proline/betaine transporter-like MFS transporter